MLHRAEDRIDRTCRSSVLRLGEARATLHLVCIRMLNLGAADRFARCSRFAPEGERRAGLRTRLDRSPGALRPGRSRTRLAGGVRGSMDDAPAARDGRSGSPREWRRLQLIASRTRPETPQRTPTRSAHARRPTGARIELTAALNCSHAAHHMHAKRPEKPPRAQDACESPSLSSGPQCPSCLLRCAAPPPPPPPPPPCDCGETLPRPHPCWY